MARKLTYEEVRKIFEDNNCSLVSQEYINSRTKLEYICVCGNLSEIRIGDFKSGTRCMECSKREVGDRCRFSYEFVYNFFKDAGCILLSETYKSNNQKLEYICRCGNESTTMFINFIKGKQGCETCHRKTIADKKRLTFDYVKKIFEDSGCTLIDTEYVNINVPIKYICSCGNKHKTSLSNFQKGSRCSYCAIEKMSGENHHRWNYDLTDEERIIKRSYPEYHEWVQEVFSRDDYTCQLCSKRNTELNAHHLDGYHWCKDKRTDINNGVTLCVDCHKDFHRKYGRQWNTREQFEEYTNEFKEINIKGVFQYEPSANQEF